MGVLVDDTITKANNHFGPYCDNEAESTHDFYEIFLLRPPEHAGEVSRFHCGTPVSSQQSKLRLQSLIHVTMLLSVFRK
jgi:hypothetical protein